MNDYAEQSEYNFFECKECGFDSVQKADFVGSELCPLCLSNSGHAIKMQRRIARTTDDPEGIDMRLQQ